MEFIVFWLAIGDWKIGLMALPVIVLIQGYLGRLTQSLWSFGGIVKTFYDGFSDAQEMALILNNPYASPYPQIRRVGKLISNDSTIIPYSFCIETS